MIPEAGRRRGSGFEELERLEICLRRCLDSSFEARSAPEDSAEECGELVVAVSGGVDSMTLAVVAKRALGSRARMFHAISPAVPRVATERVRRYAEREGWRLEVADAGEFRDAQYLANPADRCYFCKTHLYSAISEGPALTISGTNLDDLSDYRPGLAAADAFAVRHPYVEAGITKEGVRSIARHLDLTDLAELPASPCLSSRIETGIEVAPELLLAVDACESLVGTAISPRIVRCRVRSQGVVVELDAESLDGLDDERRKRLSDSIASRFNRIGASVSVTFAAYRMGSAFLRAGVR